MIKHTVKLFGIQPEMVMIHIEVRGVFLNLGYECVFTSGLDSHEGRVSFHNIGFALDYRTKHMPEWAKIQLIDELKRAIPMCDFGIHSPGTDDEHLHVEFDPKNDPEFVAKKAEWKETGVWA